MKLVDLQRHDTARGYAQAYLEYVGTVLTRIDPEAVGAFIDLLVDARRRSAAMFFCGNGGSASTASHFANDLSVGTRPGATPFRAMSIVDNVSIMTAVANDFGYEQVFVRQLQTLARPGDVLVAISASGNSPNVLAAVEYARSLGMRTVGLTGFGGGRLRGLVDLSVHVDTDPGEYGPVEDAHMVLDHLVTSFLAQAIRRDAEGVR